MGSNVYKEAQEYLANVEPGDLFESRHAVVEFTREKHGAIAMAVIVTRTWDQAFRRGLIWGTVATSAASLLLRVLL